MKKTKQHMAYIGLEIFGKWAKPNYPFILPCHNTVNDIDIKINDKIVS